MARTRSSGKYISSIRSVFLFAFLLLSTSLFSQLSSGGLPPSSLFSTDEERSPLLLVDAPDPVLLREEDIRNPLPYRFAVNLPVDRGIGNEGKWDRLPDGSSIWRMKMRVPGALALALYFDKFHIPPGGRLFVYDPDKNSVLGAFTEANNRYTGLFSTGLVPGDMITLEYHKPSSEDPFPELNISEIAYAYRGVSGLTDGSPSGTAGPCEVNINCPEGSSWQAEKRGVIRIQTKKFGGSYWCSGTLINNTRQDGTPYVLTADHCGQGATPQDYSLWVFYFGYEGDLCIDPNPPPVTYSLSGSTVKASSGDVQQSGSDFLLLLLDDTVPGFFNPYFNGWNRIDDPSPNGVSIHHPMGDLKKISTYTTPVSSSTWAMPGVYTHWRVKWAETQNGHGVTEGGSSGSPLFDNNGAVIGSETGGESTCDSINLNKPDYYGKFSYSWNSNGTDSTKQLSYWLDPLGTGAEILEGIALGRDDPHDASGKVLVFPNPFSSELTVVLPSQTWHQQVQMEILDVTGKIIFRNEIRFTQPARSFPFSDLLPGIYLMRITDRTAIYNQKIIKK